MFISNHFYAILRSIYLTLPTPQKSLIPIYYNLSFREIPNAHLIYLFMFLVGTSVLFVFLPRPLEELVLPSVVQATHAAKHLAQWIKPGV